MYSIFCAFIYKSVENFTFKIHSVEYGGYGKIVHPNEAIVSLVLMLSWSSIVMK